MNQLEVIILATQQQKRAIEQFESHLSQTKRNYPNAYIHVVYTQNVFSDLSSIPTIPRIIVVCLNSDMVDMTMADNHILQTLYARTVRLIPFVFQECIWDFEDSPFYNHTPLAAKPLSATSNKNKLFVDAVLALEGVIQSVSSTVYSAKEIVRRKRGNLL